MKGKTRFFFFLIRKKNESQNKTEFFRTLVKLEREELEFEPRIVGYLGLFPLFHIASLNL